MNRSVINVLIAAGVLAGGVGVGAVPAVADQGEPGVVSGSTDTDTGKPDTDKPDTDKPDTDKPDTGKPDDGTHPPAHRPPRPDRDTRPDDGQIWPCRPAWNCPVRVRRNLNRWLPVPPTVRLPQAPGVDPQPELPALVARAVPAVPQTAPPAPAAVAPPLFVPPASAAPRAPLPAAPIRSLPPPPAAVPAVPAAPAPAPAADRAEALRVGYPEELRNADFRKVASVALPGLAAIAGMTALGGMVGYRQARAGYVLRTAGAGRFLQ